MKQSDSTNSLTELNKDDATCFVCLEIHTADLPLVDSAILRSCGCKFSVHAPCWNQWLEEGKSDYDCPICGKRSLHMGLNLTAPFQLQEVPEPVTTDPVAFVALEEIATNGISKLPASKRSFILLRLKLTT